MLKKMLAALMLALIGSVSIAGDTVAKPVTVFAAASFTNVMDELGQSFMKSGGAPVRFSFAASSTLGRQIESGAGAEIFVSADLEWMDYLEQRNLIQKSTRHDLLSNRLALIAPADSQVTLDIKPGFALAEALGGGRLSTGDPDNVPVGRYARSALMSLGVWNDVADRLVRAEDVRTALAFVARAEAPLGIVYATDARIEKRVKLVGLFPESSHPRITYPIALTKVASPDAEKFVDFLRSDEARDVFERYGFIVLR